MVKNSWLPPVEVNKKPIETVYEIKNEYKVPSFEEFMKTYESDGSLNYDDLSGGSVGEVGGYGPCHRYCGYDNKNCMCYVGEEYVALYLTCPVPKGVEFSWGVCNDRTEGQWYHRYCGGSMYINTELNVKCMKPGCGTDGHMSQWRFACSSHPADYEYASSREFSNALLTLTNLWKNKNEVVGDMVRDMARNMRKPEHKQRFKH